jgi:hypothetical protein
MRNTFKILVRKHEGKRPLRIHRLRQRYNIKMERNWVGGCGLDSSGSDRDCWWAFVNTVMKLQVQ